MNQEFDQGDRDAGKPASRDRMVSRDVTKLMTLGESSMVQPMPLR